jgi:hypothetical protein
MLETKADLLKFLSNIDVWEMGNYRGGFSHTLKREYDSGVVNDAEIEEGIYGAVILSGKKLLKHSIYRHDFNRRGEVSNIIAYGLIDGSFSDSELDFILGQVDSVSEFVKGNYEKGLVDRLKKELLSPIELRDDHCAGECGCC